MPLFGSKHNKHNDAAALENTTGGGRHHQMAPSGAGTFGGSTTGPTTGTGMTGHNNDLGYSGQPGMAGTNTLGQGQHGLGHTGQNLDNNYAGVGAGGGMGHTQASGPGAAGIPPTGAVNHGNSSGGAGTRLTGKVESAVGSLVGSNALKAKGLQKEQEANAVKLQGRELAEAERLEREALMRRERAVGHGAHPANAQLGAGHTHNVGPGGNTGGLPSQYN